jgi:hypothetical protein
MMNRSRSKMPRDKAVSLSGEPLRVALKLYTQRFPIGCTVCQVKNGTTGRVLKVMPIDGAVYLMLDAQGYKRKVPAFLCKVIGGE